MALTCAATNCPRTADRSVRLRLPGWRLLETRRVCARHADELAREGLIVDDSEPAVPVERVRGPHSPTPQEAPMSRIHTGPHLGLELHAERPMRREPEPLVVDPDAPAGACRIAGCDTGRPIKARGLCSIHYDRAHGRGLLDEVGLPRQQPKRAVRWHEGRDSPETPKGLLTAPEPGAPSQFGSVSTTVATQVETVVVEPTHEALVAELEKVRRQCDDMAAAAAIHRDLNRGIAEALDLVDVRRNPETGEAYLPSWRDMPERVTALVQEVDTAHRLLDDADIPRVERTGFGDEVRALTLEERLGHLVQWVRRRERDDGARDRQLRGLHMAVRGHHGPYDPSSDAHRVAQLRQDLDEAQQRLRDLSRHPVAGMALVLSAEVRALRVERDGLRDLVHELVAERDGAQ